MMPTAERLEASPTLLVGVGATGVRLSRHLGERLANSFLSRAGMLWLVEGYDKGLIARRIAQMTGARTVRQGEAQLDLRAPHERYIRLQLVVIANVAELDAAGEQGLLDTVKDFRAYPHPPEGLSVGIALDASAGGLPACVAPRIGEVLEAIESALADPRSDGAAPLARVVLAHRALLDGTHLDHRNLEDPDSLLPDEFELTFAGFLEGMLRPGPNPIWTAADRGTPSYLFVGGGSATFPRELLLASAGRLLGADLLDRTIRPESDEEAPTHLVEPREKLFQRAVEALADLGLSIEARTEKPKPPSLFARLFGDGRPPDAARGIGLSCLPALGPLNTASARDFAAAYTSDRERLLRDFERNIVKLLAGVAPRIAAEAAERARRAIDAHVAQELGGVDRARRSIDLTLKSLLQSLTEEELRLLRLAEPDLPSDVQGRPWSPPYVRRRDPEFVESTGDLLRRLERTGGRLPQLPAVAARALMVGALASPLFAALGLAGAPGTVAMGASLAVFSSVWEIRRRKSERMKTELQRRLEDDLGELANRKVHEILGVTKSTGDDGAERPILGVLPQLCRYLEHWEKPLVLGFDHLRTTGIETMRRLDCWPDGFLPGCDWVDDQDPWLVHAAECYPSEEDLVRAVRRLLTEERLFAGWRGASYPGIEAHVVQRGRKDRLEELETRSFGKFFKWLSSLMESEDRDRFHAERVVRRLNSLAKQCMPLARAVEERDEERTRLLTLWVPKSLEWTRCAALVAESTKDPPGGIPETSGFVKIREWLAVGANPELIEDEADHTSAIALFPAPYRQTALKWLGHADPAFLPSDGTRKAIVLSAFADDDPSAQQDREEDCPAIASSLEKLGFRVESYVRTDEKTLRERVASFAAGLKPGDLAFFVFNGHGCEVDGANILSTADGGSYNLDELLESLQGAGSTNVIVLDCCRVVRAGDEGGPLKRVTAPENTLLAFSTTESQVSWNGMYCPELAKALLEPDLRLEDVFRKTREAVIAKSEGKQISWEESSLEHVVVLNPSQR